MKRYHLYLFPYVFLSFLLLFSCKKKTNRELIFESVEILEGKNLPINFMLGRPYQLKLLDSLLIIADRVESKALTIYDYKNNKLIKEAINIGQGPNEIILPIQVTVNIIEKKIGILERQKGTYTLFRISDILNTPQISNSIYLGNIDLVSETSKGYISQGFYDKGSLGVHDKNGKLMNVINIYPHYINEIKDISTRYRFGQGPIAFNKKSNLLAFAGYFSGEIKFYHLNDSNKLDIEKLYNLSIASTIEKRINEGSTNIEKTDIEYFTDIYSTDDYFYILYSGEKMEDRETIKKSHIIIFNSFGEFVKCYKSNNRIQKICVDENNEYLYALALSDNFDYVLLQMKLKL